MKNAIRFLTLVALLSFAHAVHGAHENVIFSQEPLPDPGGGFPVAALSQNDTSFDGFGEIGRAYDNFWFDSQAWISDIHWRGAYDMDPEPNHFVDSFVITIWADVGGAPGTGAGDNLLQQIVPATSETFVAIETGISGDPVYVFDYEADFDEMFHADPATTYWVSIMANLSTTFDTDPFHGWHFALGGSGDGLFVQDFDTETFLGADDFNGVVDPGEGRLLVDADLAFRLTGVIPEPSSVGIWLVLATAAGFGMTGRRRRVRAN